MLQLFLELIDRVINLIEIRNKRSIESVPKLIEPIYSDLRKIHQNYLDIFSDSLHKIETCEENNTEIVEEIINDLKKDRVKLLSIRDGLYILSTKLVEAKLNSEIIEFFEAVRLYFPTPDFEYGEPPELRSAFSGLIGDLLRLSSGHCLTPKDGKLVLGKVSLKTVSEKINRYLLIKQQQWKDVCEKYAIVKVMETGV